jgi:signal transduction histidine kinase
VIKQLHSKQAQQVERLQTLSDQAEFGMYLLSFFHDLSTPISVLNLYLDELSNREWIMSRSREHQTLVDGAVRSNLLINEYMRQARERFGQVREVSSFSVADIISDVVTQYQSRAEKIGVVLVVNVSQSFDEIFGVRMRLFQVISNLVANALDAYELNQDIHRREILISATFNEESTCIELQDWAGGICEADQNNIFEPFFLRKTLSILELVWPCANKLLCRIFEAF